MVVMGKEPLFCFGEQKFTSFPFYFLNLVHMGRQKCRPFFCLSVKNHVNI